MDIRQLILNADDRPRTAIEVPEWGATLYARPLTVGERMAVQDTLRKGKDSVSVSLVAVSVTDEQGNKVFSEEDHAALAQKNGNVLERLALKLIQLNGLDGESAGSAKNG